MPSTLGSASSSKSASPIGSLAILPFDDDDNSSYVSSQPPWRTILADSHQVVLYNSDSHALSVRPHSGKDSSEPLGSCPYCNRPLDNEAGPSAYRNATRQGRRAPNYFQLLEIANESSSRPSSSQGRSRLEPAAESDGGSALGHEDDSHEFRADTMAEGYFHAFFKEEYRLGMGANGSVFLCQHVLDGNPLGYFAVKKIAVGQSHSYLLKILREVRLLEQLHHPNIITYHHAWLETHQFSSFGPKVPTLFVLMQWAEGGSLDDFIDLRLGRPHSPSTHSGASQPSALDEAFRTRSERIRAFRAMRSQPEEERERRKVERARGVRTAVHLLSAEEAKALFTDVTAGLGFLHDKSILHLDLKPGNVLLTWDDGRLIPRAMLSDFGTSRDMIRPSSTRSGNTGTLEYTAPEALRSPQTGLLSQVDSKADMWSLGMILHMLLFFRLPYHNSSDGDMRSNGGGDIEKLEKEVLDYEGFRRTSVLMNMFERRGLPGTYLILLESLLHRLPKKRPSCEQVLRAIAEGNFDPPSMSLSGMIGEGTLVPRKPSPPNFVENVVGSPSSVYEGNGEAHFDEEPLDDPQAPSELELDTPRLPTEKGDDLDDVLGEGTSPLLALPPTTFPQSSETSIPHWFRPLAELSVLFMRRVGLTPAGVVRIIKSAVLALKVLHLFSTCPDSRLEPLFLCFTLGLAIGDTWSDNLFLTPLLAFVHVFILRFHCSHNQCCISTLTY
ncbi:kinase-like protein [Sanghuangporus baumii]|uniref:non-specific serine/threonine protein kinase n=1 Tax=Sanghuangporus baumii TaxID=108892 RepID=A0A9Q5I358_SANBA|nr:kinase-like protein [Sanghuangporus baumii]